MLARLTFFAVILSARSAAAQISPEEARAHADALITKAEAGQWFVNVSEGDTPRVHHVPSGMICVFPSVSDQNVINVYPSQPDGPARGDDVGCAAWWGRTYVSMIATRYPQAYGEEDLFVSAAGDILRSWDDAKPIEGQFGIRTFGDQPPPRVAAFSGSRNGQAALNVLVVRNIGPWTFKARGTERPGGEETITLTTGIFGLSLPGGWDAFLAED